MHLAGAQGTSHPFFPNLPVYRVPSELDRHCEKFQCRPDERLLLTVYQPSLGSQSQLHLIKVSRPGVDQQLLVTYYVPDTENDVCHPADSALSNMELPQPLEMWNPT